MAFFGLPSGRFQWCVSRPGVHSELYSAGVQLGKQVTRYYYFEEGGVYIHDHV